MMYNEEDIILNLILPKLTPTDIKILYTLVECTVPQFGISKDTIKNESEESYHNVFLSINRLELVGFIDTLKIGRKNCYYITSLGSKVIELLKNN